MSSLIFLYKHRKKIIERRNKMGYSHYYEFKSDINGFSDEVIQDVEKVIERNKKLLAYSDIEEHDPKVTPEKIYFNGDHETFVVEANTDWNFCKTNQKPYDLAVCEVLLVLKHHYGEELDLRSDGFYVEKEELKDLRNINSNWLKAIENIKEEHGYEFNLSPSTEMDKLSGYEYYSYQINPINENNNLIKNRMLNDFYDDVYFHIQQYGDLPYEDRPSSDLIARSDDEVQALLSDKEFVKNIDGLESTIDFLSTGKVSITTQETIDFIIDKAGQMQMEKENVKITEFTEDGYVVVLEDGKHVPSPDNETNLEGNKKEKILKEYNKFIKKTYEQEEEYTLKDLKKDVLLPLAYTQVEDNEGSFEYEKQVSYDIEKERIVNQLYNEYVEVTKYRDYPFEIMEAEIGDMSFESFMNVDSFNIDIDEISETIHLSAHTKDVVPIRDYAQKNNLEIKGVYIDEIIENRDQILQSVELNELSEDTHLTSDEQQINKVLEHKILEQDDELEL